MPKTTHRIGRRIICSSFANNPGDLSDRCGLNLHSDDADRMVPRTMHRRCPKQRAMCIRLQRIDWSEQKISRCDERRVCARIASESHININNVHMICRYQHRYRAKMHNIAPVYGQHKTFCCASDFNWAIAAVQRKTLSCVHTCVRVPPA